MSQADWCQTAGGRFTAAVHHWNIHLLLLCEHRRPATIAADEVHVLDKRRIPAPAGHDQEREAG